MQNLMPNPLLGFLTLGAVLLCVCLVILLRGSVRTRSRVSGPDPVQLREVVESTRSTLMELRAMLSSEVVGNAARHATAVSLLGKPEVELFQKVRKYQMASPEAALGEQN